MQNTLSNTQKQLVDSIAGQIDAASFRQCYERRDSSVRFFVIVSSNCPMAEVVASLLEGSHKRRTLRDLGAEGVVNLIPTIYELLRNCAGPTASDNELYSLRVYLAGLMTISDLLRYCAPPGPDEKTLALLLKLPDWMNAEVLAYYSPPAYFIQFTGQGWE